MKIKTSEILISLMIITFIGFILFFVASHLANKKETSIKEKNQISDTDKDVPNQNIQTKTQQSKQNFKTTPQTKPSTKNVMSEAITKTSNQPITKTPPSVRKSIQKDSVIQNETVQSKKQHLKQYSKTVPQTKPLTKNDMTEAITNTLNQPKSITKARPSVRKSIQKDRVIQYETVRDNSKHPDHSLMDERKKTFGINESLDLIVKPDEKVRVGDSIAPIKKISERLQLDQGKIIEDNIDEPFQLSEKDITSNLSQNTTIHQDKPDKIGIEKQIASVLNQNAIKESIPIELNNPEKAKDEQAKSIPGYPYIDESSLPIKDLLNAISKKQSKESKTVGDISPETQLNVYPPQSPKPYETSTYLGIRVVQPGTNIWEIHFALLKEYFQYKGVKLSPNADEPKKSGESSGIGKILKFSEQLVNIYNLKTQTFEHDLDVLQPMTVIVIYNMSQIFGILDDIDYSVIDRIEFDGESLWIPSVSMQK